MSSTSLPTYSELFADTLDLVCGQRRIQENAWPEEQEEFAATVMEALAEAFRMGLNTGLSYMADLVTTTDEVPELQPNPYRKITDA